MTVFVCPKCQKHVTVYVRVEEVRCGCPRGVREAMPVMVVAP